MYIDKTIFADRKEAGQKLGEDLKRRNLPDPVLLALPRGGVTVAHEVAQILKVPLDVIVSRKIGAPYFPEYGIGAVSEDEVPLFNPEGIDYLNLTGPEIVAITAAEKAELRRRVEFYRHGRRLPDLKGKTVILIDDGLATGVTSAAAGRYLSKFSPRALVLAVPVGPRDVSSLVADQFDEIICLHKPPGFNAVGIWYAEFDQVSDKEVVQILEFYHPSSADKSSSL